MKNLHLKKTQFKVLWVLALGVLMLSMSQSAHAAIDSTWTLQSSKDNVDCYYKIVNCNDQTTVLLAFDNKNSSKVKISWIELFTTQYDTEIEGMAGAKELILSPGNSNTYSCTDDDNAAIIQSYEVSPAYLAKVSAFKFGSLTITTLN